MSADPMLSVIMPMLNAEQFLSPAIQSILEQSYKHLELIIIDDGSKDRSFEIADHYRKLDSRVNLIRFSHNQGVAAASNVALQNAHGQYIARMDADDISLPSRFSKQVQYLEDHPEVGILGGRMQFMDETDRLLFVPPVFQGALSIRWHLFFESPFYNPTVMLRKSILDQYGLEYDLSCVHGEEDYELWSRLLPLTKGENLADVLLHYRLHSSSLTHRFAEFQSERVVEISMQAVKGCLPELSVPEQELVELQRAIQGTSLLDRRQRARLISIYVKVWEEFCRIHQGDRDLIALERKVFAWAARMILFPLFQPGSYQALWYLTKKNSLWPLFLISNIPYYIARRRIN